MPAPASFPEAPGPEGRVRTSDLRSPSGGRQDAEPSREEAPGLAVKPQNDATLTGSAGQGRFAEAVKAMRADRPAACGGGSYQRASRPRLAPFKKMPSPEFRPVPATLVLAKSNWLGARARPLIQIVL